MIVQRLHAIQHEHGKITDADLEQLAADTGTPLYRLQELVSFFPHFRRVYLSPEVDEKTGKRRELNTLSDVDVLVCRDMSCHLRGAPKLREKLEACVTDTAKHVVEGVSCLGRCDRAPAIVVNRHTGGHGDIIHEAVYAGRTHDDVVSVVKAIFKGESPKPDYDKDYSDAHIDRKGWQVDVYADAAYADKPYDAVRQYVAAHPDPVVVPEVIPPPTVGRDGKAPTADDISRHREDFIKNYSKTANPWMERLSTAGLTGFGGAGIRTYDKWFEVWKTKPVDGSADKYIVCNGDESEPSTFKDRELLLQTPHLVIEGVILAGLMTNAKAGYIYVRHEYTEQINALKAEIERAKSVGACGTRIFGTQRAFPVTVFTSPGGYICGEESALIEAMEDRRGQPRNKPPEMQTNGLYDKPTVVNNVETLAWVPAIVLKGGEWYAKAGTGGARGRRFFSICGDLNKPGVFEVKTGTTLGELIQMAGGLKDGMPLAAMALSGPSGGLVPAKLQVPADFETRFQKNIADLRAKAEKDKAKLKDDHEKKIAAGRKPPAQDREAADASGYTEGTTSGITDSTPELEKEYKAALDKIESNVVRAIDTFTKLLRSVVPEGAKVADITRLPLDKGLIGTIAPYLNYKLMLGAGIAVYAGKADVIDHALRFTEFFRNESCGKCVPCRIGSQKLADIGHDILTQHRAGKLTRQSLEMLRSDVLDLDRTLQQTSICGLGRVAGSPLATTLVYFEDEIVNLAPATKG